MIHLRDIDIRPVKSCRKILRAVNQIGDSGEVQSRTDQNANCLTLQDLLKCHLGVVIAALVMMISLTGCDRLDMYDQPRYEALEASKFFADGLSARPREEGTIPRGGLRNDLPFFTGRDGEQLVTQIPEAAYRAIYDRSPQRFDQTYPGTDSIKLRQALLERGHERFDIYCSVCHGRTGAGDGMVVRRGFKRPPAYHADRLRQAASGHLFDVISQGFGAMPSYASQIDVADRWAIVAYIRALQLSQNAGVADVPDDQRGKFELPGSVSEAPAQSEEKAR